MNRYFLQKMVNHSSDEDLMKSRMNCHTMDVSSIVLKTENGCLTRVFLAWPGHQLHKNAWPSDDFTVGIHNHRYDLTITKLLGVFTNEIYENIGYARGTEYAEYDFVSGVESGTYVARRLGSTFLKLKSCQTVTGQVDMKAEELHTVAAFGPAAWLVEEGPQRFSETRLFTNSPIEQDGRLYQSFESPDAVRAHCLEFLQLPDFQ